MKKYKLLNKDGPYESETPGTFGGYKPDKIYGRLDCRSALQWIQRGFYVKHRVFFATEQEAIECGYRPCKICMKEELSNNKKKCSRCHKNKNVDQFFKSGAYKDGLQYVCKKCNIEGSRRTRPLKTAERRGQFAKQMGTLQCGVCEMVYETIGKNGITFHHLDPAQKLFSIGRMIGNQQETMETILKETKKCIMLCWPCHMILEGIKKHECFRLDIINNIVEFLREQNNA